MISATSPGSSGTVGALRRLCQSRCDSRQLRLFPTKAGLARARGRCYVVSDQRDTCAHDAADATREFERRAEVDGDDNHARQAAAPEGGNPLGPVLGPEQNRVALAEPCLVQTPGESARGGGHIANSDSDGF